MLKYFIDTIESVPGPDRAHYKPVEGGGFALDVSDHPAEKKVAEFRSTNVELMKKVSAFEGLDPKIAREAIAAVGQANPRISELETQLAAEKTARQASDAAVSTSVLRTAVS